MYPSLQSPSYSLVVRTGDQREIDLCRGVIVQKWEALVMSLKMTPIERSNYLNQDENQSYLDNENFHDG